MNPHQYKKALEILEMSHASAARHFGVSRRSSLNYAAGNYPVPKIIAASLAMVLAAKQFKRFPTYKEIEQILEDKL